MRCRGAHIILAHLELRSTTHLAYTACLLRKLKSPPNHHNKFQISDWVISFFDAHCPTGSNFKKSSATTNNNTPAI
ncbi:hypothetical protein T12_12949 [Trichinella patagoniensis]|uniref:Uncharacterized protein n=1 Tax=Trichinella patagoniensis TaxID=990121 RepID=A0A0V0ZWJ7_9BILA|nr:hypothetical protein T12_12949 [Trichinella patagoniensis]